MTLKETIIHFPPPRTLWTGFSLPKRRKILDWIDGDELSFSLSESDEDEEESWSWIFSAIFSTKDSGFDSSCSWLSAMVQTLRISGVSNRWSTKTLMLVSKRLETGKYKKVPGLWKMGLSSFIGSRKNDVMDDIWAVQVNYPNYKLSWPEPVSNRKELGVGINYQGM